jgi:hypothetical protein
MSQIKTLFENKWINVIEKTTENNGKYIYSAHPWCNSIGVAVLGYMNIFHVLHVLGRYEICPAHSDEVELCALTGGYDNSNKYTVVQCALNELREEGGYIVTEDQMIYLGSVKPSKSSDLIIDLFAVDLNNIKRQNAESDGTLGEVGSYCNWISGKEAIKSKDPLLSVMIGRLKLKLEDEYNLL